MRIQQRGSTFLSFLLGALAVLTLAVQLVHFVPPYMEYHTICNIMQDVAKDPNFTSWDAFVIGQKLDERLQMNEVYHVTHEDFHISQEKGLKIMEVKYQVVIPVVGNLSGLLDFQYQVEGALSEANS